MAQYDYKCGKCGKGFTVTMAMSEYDRKKVKCPKCDSTAVARVFSSINVQTSKKS